MAKFRYRMQNILDLEEQKKLQEIVLRRASYERILKESMMGTIDVRQVSHARADVNTMKTLMRRQMIEVHKAEMQLEDARKKLNEVMMERKTHEKLKEKAFEQFKEELKAEESKEIDQLVSYTYNGR